MQISLDDSEMRKQMDRLKVRLPIAAKSGGQAGNKRLAEKLEDQIRRLIPNKGGWYDIYRNSVRLVEVSPDQFELTTEMSKLEFGKLDAASTILELGGGDEVANFLYSKNPWTVDTVPAIEGGIRTDIVVRPGSDAEVDTIRRRQRADWPVVKAGLEALQRRVLPDELPVINGSVMADVPFLARRLEFGLGGFQRTQIWGRLPTDASNMSDDKDVTEAAADAFMDRIE